ncbi:hypothetical protein RvY_07151 [Ramazzottius varieornatus]|uniref:Dickkopf N-terminal cysteine-rich domain-containing protein n=1 Tax=Ramazzottius varieornatus TaxID=947166 RepID=A0A1D1V1C8_RAMVA|nr:hypothetical protein RvY_07151 [Ramazzottius varieornatus]
MDVLGWLLRLLKTLSLIFLALSHGVSSKFWGLMLSQPLSQSDLGDAALDREPGSPSNDTLELSPSEKSTRHFDDNPGVCSTDKPCGRGKYCDTHYKRCERLKRRGEFCRKDYNCQRRNECVFGRCRKEIPKGQEGSRCADDKDCSANHCCARQHGEFVCKPRLQLSQRCFVPAGGLDYSLNEQCPCEGGLVCQYEPVKSTTQSPTRKNEWFQFTAETAQMKCLPVTF